MPFLELPTGSFLFPPWPATAGGGGEALFAVVGVVLEKAPVGDAGDEEADKTHDHEAEREVEHRRSIVEKGVHRHQGEKADDDAVEPGEDFDEHLFGASRRMAVRDHHVDEPRRHRHDDTRLHEGYAHLVGRPVEGQQEQIQPVLTAGDLMEMRQVVRDIPVSAAVEEYALALVIGTHPDSEYAVKEVKQYVLEGASPRAAQAILLTAKARALLDGRYNVSFDDIDDVAKAALRHRLALNFDALSENVVADTIIAALQEALNGRKTV